MSRTAFLKDAALAARSMGLSLAAAEWKAVVGVIGEHDDEAEICNRFANRIRAYGVLHLRDRSAADDLVQHVLVAVVVALREARIEDP